MKQDLKLDKAQILNGNCDRTLDKYESSHTPLQCPSRRKISLKGCHSSKAGPSISKI
jgi:hypothetical protein